MPHHRKTRLGWLKASGSMGVPLVPDVPQFFLYSASRIGTAYISIFILMQSSDLLCEFLQLFELNG